MCRWEKRAWVVAALASVAVLFGVAVGGFLMGCAPGGVLPPVANPICDRPAYAGSLICERMAAAGIEAEHLWSIILDANDVSMILDFYTADQVRGVLDKIDTYAGGGRATYTGLIELLGVETAKAERIAGIVKRRAELFLSVDPLRSPDVRLILAATNDLRAQL